MNELSVIHVSRFKVHTQIGSSIAGEEPIFLTWQSESWSNTRFGQEELLLVMFVIKNTRYNVIDLYDRLKDRSLFSVEVIKYYTTEDIQIEVCVWESELTNAVDCITKLINGLANPKQMPEQISVLPIINTESVISQKE